MTQTLNAADLPVSELIAAADAVTERDDMETVRKELRDRLKTGFVEVERSRTPYSAAVDMTEAFREATFPPADDGAEAGFGAFIGGVAVDVANALATAERRVTYRLKTLFGFDGLRIVEEGDSWTQYPILLDDIVDQLDTKDDIAVYSLGAAGDLVADMAAKQQYLKALDKTGANALLLSGGGNDLFGDLSGVLFDYVAGATPSSLINEAAFQPVFDAVMSSYRSILSDVAASFPAVTVFGHGYDLPFPQDDGTWIGPVLTAKGIPFDVGREVLRVLMDRFNDALATLAGSAPNFVYSDLRGQVDRGPNSWHDELHPKNAGYGRAAAVIETAIRDHMAGGGAEAAVTPTASGGAEHHTQAAKVIVLDPGHGGTTTIGGSSPNNAVGPNGTLEKHLTLDVAKRTREILTDRGFDVHLTRETDVNSGLATRAGIAKSARAAAFVSIHFNASTGHNAQGTETFVHSSLSTGGGQGSKSLCLAVQSEMVAALGLRDRNALHPGGIKLGGFGVLNPSNHASGTAAVLHEVSFLDRADEEQRLGNVSYRRKIATALADGIETYLQGSLGAESAVVAMDEFGDAIELEASQPSLDAFGAPIPADMAADISNGHMIAESATAPTRFIQALAEDEARFVGGAGAPVMDADEGDEPSDHDPMVAQVFGNMTTSAASNAVLLQNLFGGVESTSFDHAAFQAFIQSLRLNHFSASEFLFLGNSNRAGRCAGKNHLPPRALWPNLANTALMIDEIRARLGAPVTISSAYRSPAYNTCIGGASASQHMRFNALDWSCSTGTPADWYAVAVAVRQSDARFNGFIQQYDTFVHIDTRHA